MSTQNINNPKYIEVKNSLPEELQPVFAELVEEYAFYALKHHGREFVSYKVLAELVRSGWRFLPQDDQQNNV